MHLAGSPQGVGDGPCLPPAGGLCLGIVAPARQLATETVDSYGTAVFSLSVPSSVAVGTVLGLQALAIRGNDGVDSVVSNAVGADVFSPTDRCPAHVDPEVAPGGDGSALDPYPNSRSTRPSAWRCSARTERSRRRVEAASASAAAATAGPRQRRSWTPAAR